MRQCIEEIINQNPMLTLQAINSELQERLPENLVSILGQLGRYWMVCCTPESSLEDAQRREIDQML